MTKERSSVVKNDRVGHSRYLMALGIFGYFLCLVADFILEYLPKGQLTWDVISDSKAFAQAAEDATPRRFACSGVLGVSSMIFITLGHVGISEYIHQFSSLASELILVGGVGSSVLGASFHLLTTTMPWIFVSLNTTGEAFQMSKQFITDHNLILQINPFFYFLFSAPLFVIIIAGKTPLPRWASIFNIAIFFMIASKLQIHGASSIAGMLMCIGLFILTGIYTTTTTTTSSSSSKTSINKKGKNHGKKTE